MQYKNVITGIVISEAHYIQMDAVDKVNWMAVADEKVEEEGGLITDPMEVKAADPLDELPEKLASKNKKQYDKGKHRASCP